MIPRPRAMSGGRPTISAALQQPTPLYLQAGRQVVGVGPSEKESSAHAIVSDPRESDARFPAGLSPVRKMPGTFEQQSEVRTFTTEPLKSPVEWTGRGAGGDLSFLDRAGHRLDRPHQRCVSRWPVHSDCRLSLAGAVPRGFDHQVLMEPGEVVQSRVPRGLDEPDFQHRATASG